MRKIELDYLIQVVANLGVIAGIIFLAVELQQNNQLLRADAISSAFETRMVRQEVVLNSDSLVTAMAKNSRGEVLTDEDIIRIEAVLFRALLGRQRDYFLYREGILTEEYLRANFPLIKATMSDTDATYSGRDFWEASKMISATPVYREFVEQCILSDCETIPR